MAREGGPCEATMPGNVDYNPHTGHGDTPPAPQRITKEGNRAMAESAVATGRHTTETGTQGHS